MKSIGMVRKLDRLGRIVLPKELRRTLFIGDESLMEIYVKEDKIILKKFSTINGLIEAMGELVMLDDLQGLGHEVNEHLRNINHLLEIQKMKK